MNRYTMPTILIATVMVAGMFAFMPVEEASTVHDTIQGSQSQIQQAEDLNDRTAAEDNDVARVTISTSNNDPFIVQTLIVCATSGADSDNGGNQSEVKITSVIIDGDNMEDSDAAGLPISDIIADGTVDSICIDALARVTAINQGAIGGILASDGGDVVIDFELEGNGDDVINSVKAVAIVDGSSTLSLVSSLP